MRRIPFFVFASVFILLCSVTHLQAQVIGADITYSCSGGSQYNFTLTVYRNCAGASQPPFQQLNYLAQSCDRRGGITLNLASSRKISLGCTSKTSSCNGGDGLGIEVLTYQGGITLDTACTDWRFYWQTAGRDGVTTLAPGQMMVEARINNQLNSCNSSPTFSGDPLVFLCAGRQKTLPFDVIDGGKDIIISSITPLVDTLTSASYVGGFSSASPLSASGLNIIPSNQGGSNIRAITLTPNTAGQRGVIAYRVEERVGGQLVGSVMREIQVIVLDCNNNFPVISGANNTTNYTVNTCAAQTLTFDIFANDSDAGQRTTLFWDGGIAGANFTGGGLSTNSKATFSWSPTEANKSTTNTFKVRAVDDACPISSDTVEATFTVVVNDSFKITLGKDTILTCGQSFNITPEVTKGAAAPYKYLWNYNVKKDITGATTAVVDSTSSVLTRNGHYNFGVYGQGNYKLKMTNAYGCEYTDDIYLQSEFRISIAPIDSMCTGFNTLFKDGTSTLRTGGAPKAWSWLITDPVNAVISNQTGKEVTQFFSTPATYKVQLAIEYNSLASPTVCRDTIQQSISICTMPDSIQSTFSLDDSCQYNLITFTPIDLPAGRCSISQRIWNLQDAKYTLPGSVNAQHTFTNDNSLDSVRFYDVVLTNIHATKCYINVKKRIGIRSKPVVTIFTTDTINTFHPILNKAGSSPDGCDADSCNYWFKCNAPTKLLRTRIYGGNVINRKFSWNTKASHNFDTLTINAIANYVVTVENRFGCVGTDNLNVKDPTTANFDFTKRFCHRLESDTIGVKSSGTTVWAYNTYEWRWDGFGQNTPPSDSSTVFRKSITTTPVERRYNIFLRTVDTVGCIDTVSKTIVVATPKYLTSTTNIKDSSFLVNNTFSASPLNEPLDSVCVGQSVPMRGAGLTVPPATIPPSYTWNMGDGVATNLSGRTQNYAYSNSAGGTTPKILKTMTYNDNFCTRTFLDSVYVYPGIIASVSHWGIDSVKPIGRCTEVPTKFTGSAITTGTTIVSWAWDFRYLGSSIITRTSASPTDSTTNVTFPAASTTGYNPNGYSVLLTVTDNKGCKATSTKAFFQETVSRPIILSEGSCLSDTYQFSLGVGTNAYNNYVTSRYVWTVDGQTSTGIVPLFKKFNTPGSYPVVLRASTDSLCSKSDTITVEVRPNPVAAVVFTDSVCNGVTTMFDASNSQSATTTSAIKEYQWIFGDGRVAGGVKTNNLYQHNNTDDTVITYNAILTVTDDNNCKNAKQFVVTVKPGTVADFSFDSLEINAPLLSGTPIPFTNLSDDNSVKWYWNFGNGDTLVTTTRDISYNYPQAKEYFITQTAENKFACRDTMIRRIDLKPYLTMPTAFSPNGDGLNDNLKLMGKAIKTIKSYKIYNRWGEEVFSSAGEFKNIQDKGWNGQYNNQDQPTGVYFIYVSAITEYGDEISFQKSVTLLR